MFGQSLSYGFLLSLFYFSCFSDKVTKISVENPRVTYFNTQFMSYVNLTTIKYGRSNPAYYVGLNFEIITDFNSTINVDMYIYELLTSQNKRSFIEFHFNWCYLVEKDMFFGAAMRAAGLHNCPHPPGPYNLANLTVNPKIIPPGFPLTKARIYANFSHTKTKSRVAEGYIDIRVAQVEKTSKSLFD